MATPGIFVSHSNIDEDWCHGFVDVIYKAGYDVWYDKKNLHVGDLWIGKIGDELEARKIFIVIVTPIALKSTWVNKEIQLALSKEDHTIICVKHKTAEITGFLSVESNAFIIDVVGQDYTSAAQKVMGYLERIYGPVEPLSLLVPRDLDASLTIPGGNRGKRPALPLVYLLVALLLIFSLVFAAIVKFASVKPVTPVPATLYAEMRDGTMSSIRASDGKRNWTFQQDNVPLLYKSTISNGIIYITSLNNSLYAIRAHDGIMIWSYKIGSNGVGGSPVVVNNVVYTVLDNSVDAVNARNGHSLRRYQVGNDNSFLPESVNVADGIIYVTTSDYVPDPQQCPTSGCSGTAPSGGTLYAFRANDGSLLWQNHTNDSGYQSPAIVNGIVYATDSASIVAFQGSNGRLLWRASSSFNLANLSVTNGIVCCGGGYDTNGHFISAFSAKDGHPLWKYPVQGFRYPYMTRIDGVLYLCVCESTGFTQAQGLGLRALQVTTGKSLWFFPKSGTNYGYVHVVLNGIAYFSSSDDGHLHDAIDALRIKDGSVAWHDSTTGLTDPIASGAILYTGIQNTVVDPHVYAIRASDGKIIWRYLAKVNAFGIQVG